MTVRPLYALPLISAAGLAAWLVPFARFGPFAYGYDSGLYRRYLIEPFVSFPNTAVPGLDHTVFIPRLLLDAARFAVSNPDIALYGTYFLLSAAGIASVYLFARHYLGNGGAAAASTLYALSAIQFTAHEEFFFKQAVALPLFLFALLALERKQYAFAALLGVLIVLSHQTTSVLYLAIAGTGYVLRVLYEKRISLRYALAGTAVAATYLLLHPHVGDKLASPPSGVFISGAEYLLWSLPLFALALLGARRFFSVLRKSPVLTGAVILCGAFVALHLPFYSRVYVFLDLLLVLPAALGAMQAAVWLKERPNLIRIGLAALLAVAAASPLAWRQMHAEPTIAPPVQETILGLSELPSASTVITSPNLLPWAQGWSSANVYAPGIFKEPHSEYEWVGYWAHESPASDRAFLSTFPQPAYVLARDLEGSYIPPCAEAIQPFLYEVSSCL